MEDIDFYLEDAEESMGKAIEHTEHELSKIRAGKAMPSLVDGIMVEYYGSPTPLSQVASVSTPDARTLTIKPWEKTILPEIEKAIMNSDLGLNPQNDGDIVRLNIPILTEERRIDLVKQAKHEAENGKISVRNIRKDANDHIKKLLKEGVSEDAVKNAEMDVQEKTNKYIKKIDDILTKKEKDIMTV
ncbi:MAG: ribosome recycling factor [Flammeovirgaceae bacterium]|nr:ribosome recycling factor [Flammeovirgaceae bacterium]